LVKFEYCRGNLFDNLQKEAIHLHACNAQGQWGPVIAAKFKERFYKSYIAYASRNNKTGDGYIIDVDDYKVGCLITSKYYGYRKDPPKQILINTFHAIKNLLSSTDAKSIIIQSPKINSGKFQVPWDLTERVIRRAIEGQDKEVLWRVWEL